MRSVAPVVGFLLFACLPSSSRAVDSPAEGTAGTPSVASEGEVSAAVAGHLDALRAEVEERRRPLEARPARPEDPDWVRSKLAQLFDVDQLVRRRFIEPPPAELSPPEAEALRQGIGALLGEIDGEHLEIFKGILEHHRWITTTTFGAEAANHAWLIAQHADRDLPFQKQVLAILEELLPQGEVLPRHYAYLHDRIATSEDRPQRFGTQGRCTGRGTWKILPIDDPDRVEARRADIGLPPMAQTEERLEKLCG